MAPENVSNNSGALKQDARRKAQQALKEKKRKAERSPTCKAKVFISLFL